MFERYIDMQNIKETVDLMISESKSDRLKAEFYQLEFRIRDLQKYMYGIESNKADDKPRCGYDVLRIQLKTMFEYRRVLLDRAEMEGIIL